MSLSLAPTSIFGFQCPRHDSGARRPWPAVRAQSPITATVRRSQALAARESHGHAGRRADRGGWSVPTAEGVVRAFTAPWKAARPSFLPQRAHLHSAAAGQIFVCGRPGGPTSQTNPRSSGVIDMWRATVSSISHQRRNGPRRLMTVHSRKRGVRSASSGRRCSSSSRRRAVSFRLSSAAAWLGRSRVFRGNCAWHQTGLWVPVWRGKIKTGSFN